jgi:hypothetical protein
MHIYTHGIHIYTLDDMIPCQVCYIEAETHFSYNLERCFIYETEHSKVYLQQITKKRTIYLILNCTKKITTCFNVSMHHLQGVLLLNQSYMPVKMQCIST